MTVSTQDQGVELFSTCPPYDTDSIEQYRSRIIDVARWSESAGCRGILVYSDNGQIDPWTVAQLIIENTTTLCPLIAIQPVYMHPYTVAKKVSSIAGLYGRQVYLNMIAGGFRNDLKALDDNTPHDSRYDRLQEYTLMIMALLRGGRPVSVAGSFYSSHGLRLLPQCPEELLPGVFMSGSSAAGRTAALNTGALPIEYPGPSCSEREQSGAAGIRVGLVARQYSDQAWNAAFLRFPADRKGQILHDMAMKVSDSVWHEQLSDIARERQHEGSPYWLVPFENYRTMCPYLVGSYQEVGDELSAYMSRGYKTFITDVPESPAELSHIGQAFAYARDQEQWAQQPQHAQGH